MSAINRVRSVSAPSAPVRDARAGLMSVVVSEWAENGKAEMTAVADLLIRSNRRL
jgi:hypothetical protein